MSATFVHAKRLNGRWVHVLDLDPSDERGGACNCVCSECGRPLVAHLGQVRSAHFQHLVEDAQCNPQPMTLMHEFARDYIAAKRSLWLPGMDTVITVEAWGKACRENFTLEDLDYAISSSSTELPVADVIPDVLFEGIDGTRTAVEVRYTHAVNQAKQSKIAALRLNCIEFDVSDLPPDSVSAALLERVLIDRKRWRWIWLDRHAAAEGKFRLRVGWEGSEWRADQRRINQAELYLPRASEKLRIAQQRFNWAQSTYTEYRRRAAPRPTREETAVWLAEFATEDRLAIFCAAAGIEPISLPINFMQKAPQSFWRHPYAWQLGIFVAFGFQRDPFTSAEVAAWIKIAMPECARPGPDWKTKNGFTENSAAAHFFLLLLEHQGLLLSDGHHALEKRVFRGRFNSRDEFHRHLPGIVAASGVITAR